MLLRHILRPLESTSLLLIAVFTALLVFALHAGLYGLAIMVLLLSWFFKYAYVLLDAVANGAQTTPVLSVEMLNPVDEQRPVAQVIICVVLFLLARWVAGPLGVLVAVLGLLYLPASVAVLGASSRAIDAVNPVVLTRVILGLGAYYWLILGVIVLYAIAMVALVTFGAWHSVVTAFGMFFMLSLFSMLGGALYEQRHRLGLDPTHSPERRAEREDRERSHLRARALDEVYAEARGGNFMAAHDSLLRWMRHAGIDNLERDARFFLSQCREWQDEKAFVFVARLLVTHLLDAGRPGAAVEMAAGMLERAPSLKLESAERTLQIATLARAAGRRSVALRIVTDFERQFPGDPRTAEATALRERLER